MPPETQMGIEIVDCRVEPEYQWNERKRDRVYGRIREEVYLAYAAAGGRMPAWEAVGRYEDYSSAEWQGWTQYCNASGLDVYGGGWLPELDFQDWLAKELEGETACVES